MIEAGVNKIGICPDQKFIRDKNGFLVPDEFEPGLHAPITGTVVALPSRLVFYDLDHRKFKPLSFRKRNNLSKKYSNALESVGPEKLNLGDRVIYNYAAVQNSETWEWFEHQGKKCVIVDYYLVYGVIDSKNQIDYLINGNILIETDEKHDKTKDIFTGIVTHASKPNLYGDNLMESDSIKEGTIVLFERKMAARIEVSMHQMVKTNNDKPLYRTKRRYVKAFCNEV